MFSVKPPTSEQITDRYKYIINWQNSEQPRPLNHN